MNSRVKNRKVRQLLALAASTWVNREGVPEKLFPYNLCVVKVTPDSEEFDISVHNQKCGGVVEMEDLETSKRIKIRLDDVCLSEPVDHPGMGKKRVYDSVFSGRLLAA